MIKILTCLLVIVFAALAADGQTVNKTKCELQELAIEAALGNALAQYNMGVEFFRGEQVAQDFGKAATMWRLAGAGGQISAYNNLGYLTYYGRGVKQDHAEGVRLWRIAAEAGIAESQIHIGYAYLKGDFLKKDAVEAYAWATTGKHFVRKVEDKILARATDEMANKLLTQARSFLNAEQIAEAEKRAAAYIAKFSTK
jgi:TPR repeat protein